MTINAHIRPPRPQATPLIRMPSVLMLLVGLGLVATIAKTISIPVAGLIFLVGYGLLAATRPSMALVLMMGSAPFNYDVGGLPVNMALSDICLVIATIALLPRWSSQGGRLQPNPMMLPIGAYLLLCVMSTAVTGFQKESLTSVVQMAVYMIVAVTFFANFVRPHEILAGLYALLAVNVVLAMTVALGGSNYVLGLHKNAAGNTLAVGTIIAFELWSRSKASGRRPPKLLTASLAVVSAGLLCTLSRGAWLGTVCGIGLILLLRQQVRLLVRAMFYVAPLLAIFWVFLPDQQKNYASDFSSKAENIKARYISIDFAWNQFLSSPIFGVGVGLRKLYDATNVMMSTLAETGIVGILLFLAIFAVMGSMVYRGQKELRRDSLMFSLMAIGTAVMAAKFCHGLVDHYWSRGILPIWAGAGMVVAAYGASRRPPIKTVPQTRQRPEREQVV